ncbi:type II toxin-antitoxin system RelE family toxin [Nodosilinea nodulosa]|uniref:type II toxin-antitoxin system RelE family toxin n=1 Tax=Nodosilinea nodulosa TaxID=416001 RepID=UPI0002FE794D|nr:type II toxin-antitoxin system RelE/ParE family toxin [Nodosilinea nodulosa]
MKVEFRKTFEKDLKKINDKSLLVKIKSTITAVEEASSLDNIASLKKLKGDEGHFRIRIGDYRLGLFLDGDTLLFIRIIHRREFYRYFP